MFLSVNWIDSLLASNLITISTDQAIKSNVYISGIFTTDVNARIFNDLIHFADNVVMLEANSSIECESLSAIILILFFLLLYATKKQFLSQP